jgi:hypothetical protein
MKIIKVFVMRCYSNHNATMVSINSYKKDKDYWLDTPGLALLRKKQMLTSSHVDACGPSYSPELCSS